MHENKTKKIIVGLTGGICCGKSLISNIFEKLLHIELIDADILARQVVEPNTIGLKKIIEHFGTKILNSDKSLNRRLLREIIFSNHKDKKILEDIVHPLIYKEFIKIVTKSQKDYILYVMPLLYETQFYKQCDKVITVEADTKVQLSRVMQRDQVNEQQARAVINTQATSLQRQSIADYIIFNNDDINDKNHYNKLVDTITKIDKELRNLKK